MRFEHQQRYRRSHTNEPILKLPTRLPIAEHFSRHRCESSDRSHYFVSALSKTSTATCIAHMTTGLVSSRDSDRDGAFETAKGIVTGSPPFTAPEVLRGKTSDVSADIYSLGATLLSAVTGQPVPDLDVPGIADDLRSVLERAMADRPGDRPTSAAEFGEELREAQRGRGWPIDGMALNTELDALDLTRSGSGNRSRRRQDQPGNLLST